MESGQGGWPEGGRRAGRNGRGHEQTADGQAAQPRVQPVALPAAVHGTATGGTASHGRRTA